jgi:cytochrome b
MRINPTAAHADNVASGAGAFDQPAQKKAGFIMQVMRRLRSYHAVLAVLVVLAYVTGDDRPLHAWLGYGIAAIILVRLAWALTGVPQLGLIRFYPHFEGLRLRTAMTHPAISRTLLLGIATCLIAVTLTGIAMDRGRAIGVADRESTSAVVADNDRGPGDKDRDEDDDESLVGEVHEGAANLLMLLILTHVSYLLLVKRPLALFMLFLRTPTGRNGSP